MVFAEPPPPFTIKHKRSKYISEEKVVPRSHTQIKLNRRGCACLQSLVGVEKFERMLSLDLTDGGGVNPDECTIHIPHNSDPRHVAKKWAKIQKLFNKECARF